MITSFRRLQGHRTFTFFWHSRGSATQTPGWQILSHKWMHLGSCLEEKQSVNTELQKDCGTQDMYLLHCWPQHCSFSINGLSCVWKQWTNTLIEPQWQLRLRSWSHGGQAFRWQGRGQGCLCARNMNTQKSLLFLLTGKVAVVVSGTPTHIADICLLGPPASWPI
jgi:hypothetical protein